jgi:hypothetical protein
VNEAHFRYLLLKAFLDSRRQRNCAVLFAFPFANDDLFAGEVEILDAQPGAFEDAETAAVEDFDHESIDSIYFREDGADFVDGQDDGKAFGALCSECVEPGEFDLEDFLIEEKDG